MSSAQCDSSLSANVAMKSLLARSLDTSASLTALMIVCITASSLSSTSTIAVRRSPFSLGGVPVVVVFTMVSPHALAAFSGVFAFWPFFLDFAIVIMIITVLR